MKKILSKLMGGVLLLSLSMSLTSCEGALDDILGEWSRPTPGSSTGGGTTTIAVTSVTLDADEMTLAVGDKGQLNITDVAPADATDKTVTWSSDKEAIATVDANGLVTAVAVGTAIITAKAGDKTATCEVTVTPSLSTPLTLEVLSTGTINVTSPQSGMLYSLDDGVTKTAVPYGSAINGGDLSVGTKVTFYGTATSYGGTVIGGSAQVKVYGNIMSLVDANFATTTTPTLTAINTFNQLFFSNTNLKDASGLLLPATTLTTGCYQGMFKDCTSLTTAPKELPAETLEADCYKEMFRNCSELITVPELKATTLASNCCESMFFGCSNLTTAPELKATTLKQYCYNQMFYGCSKLATAPALSATTLANFCCAQMFQDCSSLTTAPELKAETLKPSCYNQMFYGCSKLSSVICLATTLDSNGCNNWLNGAGTDASVTSRTLHIKAGGPSPTHSDWELSSSGDGSSNIWTAVADQ